MPEFILNVSNYREFESLDSFTQGYIEAAFFTDANEDHPEIGADAETGDIAPESLAAVVADCAAWQAANEALLSLAYARDYDDSQAGRDYWFTRNGHGVGFWERAALEPDDSEYERLTALMIEANSRGDSAAWDAALAERNKLKAESIGERLSSAAGRHEIYLVRGDDGRIYFEG